MTDIDAVAATLFAASLILTAVNGTIALANMKHGAKIMSEATDALAAATAAAGPATQALTDAANAAAAKIAAPADESGIVAATGALTGLTAAAESATKVLTDALNPPVVEQAPSEQPQVEGEQAV